MLYIFLKSCSLGWEGQCSSIPPTWNITGACLHVSSSHWSEQWLSTNLSCGEVYNSVHVRLVHHGGIPYAAKEGRERPLAPERRGVCREAPVRCGPASRRSVCSYRCPTCAQPASLDISWGGQQCYARHTVAGNSFFCFFMAPRLSIVCLAWLGLLHRPSRERYGF